MLDKQEAAFHMISTSPSLNPNSKFATIQVNLHGATGLYRIEVRIPYGYYESVQDIIREINKVLSKILPYMNIAHSSDNHMLKLKYNETSKRVHFVMFR